MDGTQLGSSLEQSRQPVRVRTYNSVYSTRRMSSTSYKVDYVANEQTNGISDVVNSLTAARSGDSIATFSIKNAPGPSGSSRPSSDGNYDNINGLLEAVKELAEKGNINLSIRPGKVGAGMIKRVEHPNVNKTIVVNLDPIYVSGELDGYDVNLTVE